METLRITIVGSDDGIVFWTLFGEWLNPTTGELTVDFSPKGGPADLRGVYTYVAGGAGKITWSDNNIW